MRRRLTFALLSTGLAAAGAITALTIAPAASAYSIGDLAGLGYSTESTDIGNGCHAWKAYRTGTHDVTDLGSDCDADFQARVDAYVNATCPCAQPSTTSTTATAPTPTDTTPQPSPPPATSTVTATLPAPPYADFTAAPTSPGFVTFTDASTGQVSSRVWQFGDGAAATGATVEHSYPDGTYYVTLIVIDGNGLTSLAVHQLTMAPGGVTLGPRTTQIVAAPVRAAPAPYAGITAAKAIAVAKKQIVALEVGFNGFTASQVAELRKKLNASPPHVSRSACKGVKAWRLVWRGQAALFVNAQGILMSCYVR